MLSSSSKASLADFTDHVNDKSAHSVTLLQAGAAAASHTHSVSDFISGTLPISKGGTGVTTLAELEELLGHKIVFGYFIGDGSTRMDITLGFQPLRVYMIAWAGYGQRIQYHYVKHNWGHDDAYMAMESPYLLVFAPGQNITAEGKTSWVTEDADTMFAHGYGGAAVTSTGFAVGYKGYIYPSFEGYPNGMGSIQSLNRNGECYVFAAVKGS